MAHADTIQSLAEDMDASVRRFMMDADNKEPDAKERLMYAPLCEVLRHWLLSLPRDITLVTATTRLHRALENCRLLSQVVRDPEMAGNQPLSSAALLNVVFKAHDSWYSVGRELGLSEQTLDHVGPHCERIGQEAGTR